MKKKKKIIITIVSLIALITFFPYLKAEYLTFRYGSQFKDGYEQCHMIDSIEYLRVLDYDKKSGSAKILYISEDHACADILYFKQSDSNWLMSRWETIWSKTGSADDFMWPYYP